MITTTNTTINNNSNDNSNSNNSNTNKPYITISSSISINMVWIPFCGSPFQVRWKTNPVKVIETSLSQPSLSQPTANLRTNIMDFGGFASSIILILRGGIPRPLGDLPESLSQAILVGIMLVGRLGAVNSSYR